MSSLTAIGTPSSGRSLAAAAPGVGLVGLEPGTLGQHDAERVQPAVEAFDPLQVEVDELPRGDLACGDQLGLPGDPGVGRDRPDPSDGRHGVVLGRPRALLPGGVGEAPNQLLAQVLGCDDGVDHEL